VSWPLKKVTVPWNYIIPKMRRNIISGIVAGSVEFRENSGFHSVTETQYGRLIRESEGPVVQTRLGMQCLSFEHTMKQSVYFTDSLFIYIFIYLFIYCLWCIVML
jgi:hypothetical protein